MEAANKEEVRESGSTKVQAKLSALENL